VAFSDVAIETKSFYVKSSGCRVSVKCLSYVARLVLQRFTQTVYVDCKSEKSCQKMLYFGYVFVFGTQRKGKVKGVGF